MWVQSVQVSPALWRVYWCRLSRVQDLRSACGGPLVVCPAFCPLYCFALGALSLSMALLRVFGAF